MKTYILVAITLFLASCKEQTSHAGKSRFEVSRIDKNSDPGPSVYLFKDTETGREYMLNSSWVQLLPLKKSDGTLEKE
jgi:hypothetical protein